MHICTYTDEAGAVREQARYLELPDAAAAAKYAHELSLQENLHSAVVYDGDKPVVVFVKGEPRQPATEPDTEPPAE